MKTLFSTILLAGTILMLSNCMPTKDKPGYEYIPDMGHSLAYEAYVPTARTPNNRAKIPVAGSMPRGNFQHYQYANTAEGKTAAIANLTNPYALDELDMEEGKHLYEVQCGICHGVDGAGEGDLIKSGKYPAVPPTYFGERVLADKEGGIYHVMMYGVNVMGSYAAHLNYKERWEVIQYIRTMQASKLGEANVLGYRNLPSTKGASVAVVKTMLKDTIKIVK